MSEPGSRRAANRLFQILSPTTQLYYKHSMKLYVLILTRNLIVIMLNERQLENLRWLDCWLLGRTYLGSRVPQAGRYLAFLNSIIFVFNKLILNHVGPEFNSFCLKLTCANIGEAFSMARQQLFGFPKESSPQFDELDQIFVHPALCDTFASPFSHHQLISRPTRTLAMRRFYGLFMFYAVIDLACAVILVASFNIYINVPMLFTRRGFELSRENCVRYIVTKNELANLTGSGSINSEGFIYVPESGKKLSEIYPPGKPNPVALPYEQFVHLNAYHVLRISNDIIDNLLFWTIILIVYWYVMYYVILFCTDTSIYARHLSKQLVELAEQLSLARLKRHKSRLIPLSAYGPNLFYVTHPKQYDLRKQAELRQTTRLQALVFDYLKMVRYYNPFVSLLVMVNIISWLLYILLVFVRTVRAERLKKFASLDPGVQLEFYLIFGASIFCAFILLISSSILHSQAHQLYKLINNLMAHEDDNWLTRRRWLCLLKHFEPERLYCFSLFNRIELSWFFTLKLIFWVMSALVILVSIGN